MTTDVDPWEVFHYEVQMYSAMIKIRETIGSGKNWKISIQPKSTLIITPKSNKETSIPNKDLRSAMNAFIESKLLHIRILAEILLERGHYPDDVKLAHLLPNWEKDEELGILVNNLEKAYGTRKSKDTPCWTINKMVVHFTSFRLTSFGYRKIFETIDTPLKLCIKRVAELGGKPAILAEIHSVM
ncbi:MAG: hypothetical protein DWQ07_25340 [Chloroflexi bacterium]|nr:MAG: hypothetical protein DWQ07_25340 [Chloroflexota bacterium]MBL1196139.1 hypothetical protein [Chloroflexota bacterium]NOH13432.1 hypothetical protein [Chloroflexota bacterium]